MKNNKNLLTQTLAILLLSSALFVSAQAEKIKLKPGHPEEYVVVKGDTLWDISGKFLSEPWLWPEIWQINPQVKNPHLIYPGDVLYLVYIDGKPYITRNKHGKRTVRLSPETRIEALDNAIPTIPLDIIAPFLTKNRVLNFGEFANLPYIAGMTDDRSAAGAGDSVYVVGIPQESTDTHYAVYRRGNAYRNPRNDREVLGYEAVYLGEGSLERKGDPSTLYLEKSKSEIQKSHRVIPISSDRIIDANFIPKASSLKRSARIIGVLTSGMQPGVNMVGALDIVIIDAGIKDGVETGDVLNIYKQGALVKDPIKPRKMVKLPNEINGELMVFRTFNRLSYAIVMKAHSDLRVGEELKSPYAGN